MKRAIITSYLGGFFWDQVEGKNTYYKRPWIKVESLVEVVQKVDLTDEEKQINPELFEKWELVPSEVILPINKSGDLSAKEAKKLCIGKHEVPVFQFLCEDSPHLRSNEYGMILGCMVSVNRDPTQEEVDRVKESMRVTIASLVPKTKGNKSQSQTENSQQKT